MALKRWMPSFNLVTFVAIGLITAAGCGIKTNIGSNADDDTSSGDDDTYGTEDDDSSQGDDDTSSGDDDTPSGDDDATGHTPPPGGCNGNSTNCIEGSAQGHQFGEIGTNVFTIQDDGQGGSNPYLVMADYDWTCPELQARPPLGANMPPTGDAADVVGMAQFLLGRIDGTQGTVVGATDPGSYQVIASKSGMADGTLVAFASVYFMNQSGSVHIQEIASTGTVTVTAEDDGSLKGQFTLHTKGGADFTGKFAASHCDFQYSDGGSGL